ncbi:MAG: GNAT family N-acetyltransferase [Clostridium sp.]
MEYKENSLTEDIYAYLRGSVGWNVFNKSQSIKALSRGFYDVVAYDGDKPIAMGRVIGDGIFYTVVDVVVLPEFQGKSIGTQIITRILGFLKESISEGDKISVQLIAAEGKEGFYERFGFSRLPNDEAGCGMQVRFSKV